MINLAESNISTQTSKLPENGVPEPEIVAKPADTEEARPKVDWKARVEAMSPADTRVMGVYDDIQSDSGHLGGSDTRRIHNRSKTTNSTEEGRNEQW